MTRRLLVGIGETAEMTRPRQHLVEFLTSLRALEVQTQVATFADGPVNAALAAVAEVQRMQPLPPRSAPALAQSAIRRVSPAVARKVHDLRVRRRAQWIDRPDAVHLHGALGSPLLDYVRSFDGPVTAFIHPWDFSVAGLPLRERRQFVARTDRFLVADDAVVEPLLAAGADPARIEPAPELASAVPAPPASSAERRRARTAAGVPADRPVVLMPPVPGWAALPDTTLALAWEVQRLGGPSGALLVWYGMPASGDPEWPLRYDIDHMDLENVQVMEASPTWEEAVDIADVLVLPTAAVEGLPDGFAEVAARQATPLACWEGHPYADDVARWGGTVVAAGDVASMARSVWAMLATERARHRARSAVWSFVTVDAERVAPVRVPLP
ncbi:MAG: hypothetical protein JJU45_10090 [Acidimicrobiia bacterium]|nr:hypothetical protein [Acidimicrobiia bacterium]